MGSSKLLLRSLNTSAWLHSISNFDIGKMLILNFWITFISGDEWLLVHPHSLSFYKVLCYVFPQTVRTDQILLSASTFLYTFMPFETLESYIPSLIGVNRSLKGNCLIFINMSITGQIISSYIAEPFDTKI